MTRVSIMFIKKSYIVKCTKISLTVFNKFVFTRNVTPYIYCCQCYHSDSSYDGYVDVTSEQNFGFIYTYRQCHHYLYCSKIL